MPRASALCPSPSNPCLPRSNRPGIQNFARTTKPGITVGPASSPSEKLPATPLRKRKLNELENVESRPGKAAATGKENGEDSDKEGSTVLTPSKSLPLERLALSTPRSGHYVDKTSAGCPPSLSPLKRSKTLAAVSPRTTQQQRQSTKQGRWPSQIFFDILDLYSSFLKALTFHSAHHGISASADLRELLPSIERIWKKRKVVVKDLQRLIWVWDQAADSGSMSHSYRLANYGLGKVCLERTIQAGSKTNDNLLQKQFEQRLRLLWDKAMDNDSIKGENYEMGNYFIETLGLSPVKESLTPFTSFQRGQQRLQDLKGGVIKWRIEKLHTESAVDGGDAAPKPAGTASMRRKGLWDRIKGKQLRQSKLPPPPSKDMLIRRAAAERVEEIAGVLALLRPAGSECSERVTTQRVPFRLETIIQNIQDSARSPISAEEVEASLGLLAQPEVAGQWVNIAMVKGVKSVVLKSCCDVSIKGIGARVKQLEAGYESEAGLC